MTSKDDEAGLLNVLRDIEKLEYDFRDTKTQKINIFEAAGLDRQEIRHSKALAFLLSPNEPHGLGDMFFKKIICNKDVSESYRKLEFEFSPSPLKMALADFDDLIVRREDMHIDILMWSPKNKVVVTIENKVGASEGKNQLQKYKDSIFKDLRFEGFGKIFIYLTVDEDTASDNAWISVGYKLLATTLEDILLNSRNSISDECNFFISNYVDLIRKNVMSETDSEFVSACQSLYERHQSIFDTIIENLELGGAPKDAIKSFLINNDDIKLNFSNSRWLSFIPRCIDEKMPDNTLVKDWQKQKKPIVFFFELMKDRIKLVVEVGPLENLELRNSLVVALNRSINGTERAASSNTYTRIWTKTEKLDPNTELADVSSDKIFSVMNNLYLQLKNAKVIENTKKALLEVFSDTKIEL